MASTLSATERDRAYQFVSGGDADEFAVASKAPATWGQYASSLRLFEKWATKNELGFIPTDVVTVRKYLRHLMDARRSVSTVGTFITALATAHRLRGLPFDRTQLRDTVKGIKRSRGSAPRQAKPLLGEDVRGLLARLDPARAVDVRDAAVLAVGWSGALRQSEIVGLDWGRLGRGDGFMVRDRRGLTIVLARSKTAQTEPTTIIVPAEDMPAACEAVDRWAAHAKLKPGEAVFRAIANGRQGISQRRLARDFPARMIKARVQAHAVATGASEGEAEQLRLAVSGHSLRAGVITTQALAGIPEWKIRQHSRHRSAEMVARYVRAAAQWTDSSIKGVGF